MIHTSIADEEIINDRSEIDRSEAGKYEFIHGSCIFSLLLSNIILVENWIQKKATIWLQRRGKVGALNAKMSANLFT